MIYDRINGNWDDWSYNESDSEEEIYPKIEIEPIEAEIIAETPIQEI